MLKVSKRICFTVLTILMVVFSSIIFFTDNNLKVSAEETKPEIKVFLIGGQSNATGLSRKDYLPAEYKAANSKALIYIDDIWDWNTDANFKKKITEVQPGQGMESWAFGPEIGMADVLTKAYPNEKIAFIKCAYPGSNLAEQWAADWRKEGTLQGQLYDSFIRIVGEGMSKYELLGYQPKISGMVWMQGEEDAKWDHMAPYYEKNLTDFISALRTDLNVPEMPFVTATLTDNSYVLPFKDTIIEAQKAVGSTLDKCDYVDGTDFRPSWDVWHYSADSMLNLGKRFASSLLGIIKPLNVFSIPDISLEGYAGYQPKLPMHVMASMEDATIRYLRVEWENINTDKMGDYVIEGKVADSNIKAKCLYKITKENIIVCDGELNEEIWNSAANVKLPDSTMAKYIYTQEGIYFAFSTLDNNIQCDHTDYVYSDSFYIGLDTNFNGQNSPKADDYAFIVTAANRGQMMQGNGSGWDQKWLFDDLAPFEYAVKLYGSPEWNRDTDKGFSAEFYVPWSLIGGVKNTTMGICMGRVNETEQGAPSYSYGNSAIGSPSTYQMMDIFGVKKIYSKVDSAKAYATESKLYIDSWVKLVNADNSFSVAQVNWDMPETITADFRLSGVILGLNKQIYVDIKYIETKELIDAVSSIDISKITAKDKEKLQSLKEEYDNLPSVIKNDIDAAKLLDALQKTKDLPEENDGCGGSVTSALGIIILLVSLSLIIRKNKFKGNL